MDYFRSACQDGMTVEQAGSLRARGILLAGGILRQLREEEDEKTEAPELTSGEAER